jgi:hypothetical protein
MEESLREINTRWNQDASLMGRLLRAHLFVEYFLTRYLSAKNPNLGDLELARLTFAQKLALSDHPSSPEAYLFPGIRLLNKVRNRIAHTLSATVTDEDRDGFLKIGVFREFRIALAAPKAPSNEPVDVLEEFSLHAGSSLASAASPNAKLWRDAMTVPPPNTLPERTRDR